MNTRSICTALAGLALAIFTQPALAGWTQCTVDVYSAYDKAIKNGWQFFCGGATFVPLHAERRISCQGKIEPQYAMGGKVVRVMFFGKGSTASSFYGGWKRHSFEIAGGNYTAENKAPYKVFAVSKIKATVGTSYVRKLSKLVLKKENGNCSKVYDEAFVP